MKTIISDLAWAIALERYKGSYISLDWNNGKVNADPCVIMFDLSIISSMANNLDVHAEELSDRLKFARYRLKNKDYDDASDDVESMQLRYYALLLEKWIGENVAEEDIISN